MKKVVLKLEYTEEKVRQKVMKKVSSLAGVESISIDDKDKKLTVTGSIDPVSIVAKLRKICRTEIVTVGPKEAEKKKEDGKKDDGKKDDKKDDKKKDEGKKDEGKKDEKKDDKKKDEVKAVPVPVPQQYYYHQSAYYQQQYPPPYSHPAYYNSYRTVEEDPNGSCVIC